MERPYTKYFSSDLCMLSADLMYLIHHTQYVSPISMIFGIWDGILFKYKMSNYIEIRVSRESVNVPEHLTFPTNTTSVLYFEVFLYRATAI